MKTIYSLLLLSAIVTVFSCTDKYTEERTVNTPVYMSYDDLRAAVASAPARPLVRPGKIYFKGNHLFIVEHLEGVHVIDVSAPSNPQHTGFIEIPGCVDIAIKEQSLYADSYVDLVAIDISDVSSPKVTKRLTDVFPYTTPTPDEPQYPRISVDQENGVVVGWEIKRETHEVHTQNENLPVYDYFYSEKGYYYLNTSMSASSDSNAGGGTADASFGKSGSMARFGLYGNCLYIVDDSKLSIFETHTPSTPVPAGMQYMRNGIETMFIYDGHMFLGTTTGMWVFSLRLPLAPEPVGEFWHTTSCDPVVVHDGYAYITLRAGTGCGNGTNRLDVVMVSDDYTKYTLVSSYSMVNPHGLGIDGETLFVCDGQAGLKIYDTSDKIRVNERQIAAFPDIQAYDVIPTENFLFMIGDDGFYLYDYSDLTHIRQVGHIPVEKE
ncbi:MAG: hypothetical protein LBJ23_05225 [Tannerella sp.]|jgi:hypothetical protein|nr:hypothetical protein [Tannerella sp.]